jgi:hypothetical protein
VTLAGKEVDDDELERIARGVAAVDRAVNRYQARAAGLVAGAVFRVPRRAALELGWPVCTCGRGIEPGAVVYWRGELLHPECIGSRLAAERELELARP